MGHAFGTFLAERKIGVVYGGASIGVMAAVANGAKENCGEVIGVIPKALADVEVAHAGLDKLHIVDSMHERKALMAELSDAFIALPGGIGTLEEIFEAWTWGQLGIHKKPCALLNVDGFFDSLIRFLDDVNAFGFLKRSHRDMLIVDSRFDGLLDALTRYKHTCTIKVGRGSAAEGDKDLI
jgi:uncharacterized protein (TIGR00730 family)